MEKEYNSFSKTRNMFGRAGSGFGLKPGGATNSDLENPALPTICGYDFQSQDLCVLHL